jgi:predicted NBD/HSP70 family sugar kinase
VTVSISHTLAVGVVDLAGQLVRHQKLATDQDGAKPYGRDLVRLLLPSVKGLLDGLTGRRVLGVGVIASGRVNRKGVIHWSENIPAPDLDMAKVLAPVTRLPVHTDEEFRLLLARLWAAETPPWRNAVIMSGRLLGFGGGQAAMIEGRIYYGCNGYAGQPGRCMAVLHGLDEIAAMKAWIASVGGESAYLDRVRQADPEALRVYAKCVDNYGFRIAQIANHFNPEVVLLYSPYSVLGQSFLDRVREVVRLHSEPWVTDGMEVRFAGERTDEARLAAAAGPLLDRVFVDGRLDPLIVGGRRNPHETPAQPTATPS